MTATQAGERLRAMTFKPYVFRPVTMCGAPPMTVDLAPWEPGADTTGVSVSPADARAGSPREGDMIARNSLHHDIRWLVPADYFAAAFTKES